MYKTPQNFKLRLSLRMNRAFSKEGVQIAKSHRKKCSISLALKEMQIKTMLRFHLTPVRIIRNTNNNKCWPG
jgi:hypothetical protein